MFHLMRRLKGRLRETLDHRPGRNDAGSALLVVMSAAAILFVTAAAVVGIVVFQQAQQARHQAVMRATGLAHQGMEVYLTALRIDPDYRSRVPMIAGIGQDGTWTVAADNSQNTITAVGRDRSTGLFHVIKATVTSQNFSGYTIISGSHIVLGNSMGDIDIAGSVRGNSTIDLRQSFPMLSVEYASGKVINSSYAVRTSKVSPIDFAKAGGTFPNMYTAASTREGWAVGAASADFPTQSDFAAKMVAPLSFYREPNSAANYWANTAANRSPVGKGDQPDLVGVGIDFSAAHGADPDKGLFYVRSVWAPNILGAIKTGEGAPTREQFLSFGRTDPTWNPGRNGFMGYGVDRSYDLLARGLNPNGNNVVYVGGDYDVYVTGEYSRSVTIVSERNIYIIGDLTRSTAPSASPTATLGLVAKGDIYICGSMPSQSEVATYTAPGGAVNSYSGKTYLRGDQTRATSHGEIMGQDLTIEAAMLSVNGAIVMDPRYVDPSESTNPDTRSGTLRIRGSLAAAEGLKGPNFVNDYDAQYGGFAHVDINYDEQLQDSPPPLFPQLGAGSLKIASWEEYDSNSDPNAGLSFPEPVDYRPQASIPASSLEDTYTPSGTDFDDPTTVANAKEQYLGQAVITLTAVDTGVGVGQTWFSVDGGLAQYGYTVVLPSPPANTAETHTVEFASVDRDGNREATKTVTFRMVGPDTLPPTTVVMDSKNPTMALPDGYPQQDDPDYVVYGEFNPVFTARDNAEGSGAYQVIVIQKNDPQHVSGYEEPDPPAYASGFNEDLLSPLRYSDIRVTRDAPGFITREFEYYAIDAAGNREPSKKLTIVQHAPDVTKPITFFDIQQAYIGTANLHLSGVDDIEGQGLKQTWYSLDGGSWIATTSVPATITVAAPFVGRAAENHTISFYSVDASPAQNKEETQTVSFLVLPRPPDDVTPPVTRSDAVASYVGPAVITLSPEDPGGIAEVHWRLDGGTIQNGTRVEVDAPWTGADEHTLSFWAVDSSGNVETPKVATFTVTPERTLPVSTAHNLELYAGPAVFQLTAEDNEGGSGLAGIYYKIDDGPYQLGVITPDKPGLTWVTVTGDGLHTVSFYSRDNAQNDELPKSVTFRIDTTAPTTTVDDHAPYVGQAAITLNATDTAGSGIKSTYWRNKADGLVHSTNPILLGPGTWEIMYWSVDVAGNTEVAKTLNVTVTAAPDVTAPSSYDEMTMYYKAPGPADLHLLSWDVQTGVANFYYKLDGGVAQSIAGKENPPAFYQVLVSNDGTHTIEYWADDKAGNVEAPHQTKTFVVDTVYPVTSCSARQGATYWATQTFVLGATDVGTGVKSTFYTIDGGVPIRGTSIYVPAPTDGYSRTHTIRFWSVDVAGNVESARSVTFTSKPADTVAPKTYSNAQSNYDGASTIVLSAFDNVGGSGIAHTYYRMDGGTIIEGTIVGISGSGVHTLEFWSVDVAGNVETPHNSVTYNIDNVAPTTTSDIADLYNTPATIHLTATDNTGGSGLKGTYYRLDEGLVTTGTAPLTTLVISGEGPHKLEFWSVDVAGNTETHRIKNFKIDMTPPVTTSNAQASYAGTATITLVPSDEASGSGVAYTRYRIDNGILQSGTSVVVYPPASGTVSKNITFWSVDNAGNVEAAKTVTIATSAIANMSFSAMTPSPNTTVTVRNPAVSVIAQADQKITTVTATIDGKPVTPNMTYGGGYWVSQGYWVAGYWETDGCNTWWVDPYYVDTSYYVPVDYTRVTADFGASGLLNGQHTVNFTFTNVSGNRASKAWTFGVDAPADTVAPTTVSNAVQYYSATATISLTATDGIGNTDVVSTFYKLDGGATISGTPPVTTVVVTDPGSHSLEFWSVDGAGNTETHKFSNFFIDSVPPVTYAGAASSYAGTATVYLSPTDNAGGSGVKYTYYRLDNGALSVPTVGSTTLGMWHFDEGSATALADASGNAGTGALTVGAGGSQASAATAWANGASGRFKKSIAFDGVDDYVNIGSKPALNAMGDQYSVAAWVKTSVNSGTQIIASRSNDWILQKSGSNYQFAMWTTGASYQVSAANNSTGWVYVVATYDVTASQIKLYLNGSLAATATAIGPSRRSYTQTQIGNGYVWHTGSSYYNDNYWNGQIDEVVFSNVARGPEDIKACYDAAAASNVAPLQLSVLPPLSGAPVPHSVQYYSIDNAGNVEATKSVSFTVSMAPDNTPPTTSSNSVASYSKPATITLTAVDNPGGWGVANTYYRLDNNATQTGTGVGTGLNGDHVLRFWSVDAAGNVETPKVATYTVQADTWAPVTTCNALSYYIGPASLALSASDVGWGVANTYYKLDDNATQTGTAVSVPAPISGVAHHTLLYWSTDLAGNKEDTKASYFDVYAVPYPMTFSNIFPGENAFIASTNPTVTVTAKADQNIIAATATFDGSPVAVTVTPGGGYWVPQGYWVYGHYETDGCSTWWVDDYWVDTSYWVASDNTTSKVAFKTNNLVTGPHTAAVTFTVASGAQATKVWTFVVDLIPPTTTSNMQPSYTGTATISLTATDNAGGSGVNATFYKVDGATQVSGTVITVAPPSSGFVSHTITYWSVDNVGNIEGQRTQTFTQNANPDITPPVTTSNATASYASPSLITLTATDNTGGWGVRDTYYQFDGGAVTTGTAPITQVSTGAGGVHTLRFWSVDRANNAEAAKTVTYTVTPDTTAPTVLSNAVSLYSGTATITITATDTAGGWGVESVSYRVDSSAVTTVTSPWTTLTVPGPFIGSADHTLYFWATDRAGNRSGTMVATFTINALPAPIGFSNFAPPKNGATQTINPVVSVLGSTGTTITGVTALLDGVAMVPVVTYSTTTTGGTQFQSGSATLSGTFVGLSQFDSYMRWGPDWFDAYDNALKWTCYADFNMAPYAAATITNTRLSWNYLWTSDDAITDGQQRWIGSDTGARLVQWGMLTYPNTANGVAFDSYLNAKRGSTARFVWDSDLGDYGTGAWGIETGLSAPTLTFDYSGTVTGVPVTVTDYTKATAAIPTVGLAQGWHTASFTYTVFNGSQATTSWNFCVDSIAPVTTGNVQTTYTGTAGISLTATDGPNGSGVNRTLYRLDGGVPQTGTYLSVGAPLSYSTTHTIEYWSVDNAGNVESSTIKTFVVNANYDGTPPETLVCNVKPYYNAPSSITITATDAGWGIATITYIQDGTTTTVNSGGVTFPTGGVGKHTLEYWAVDRAGNSTTHRYATYIVDMTAPSTTSNVVATYTAAAYITLTATDGVGPAVSGIGYTYYKLDGNSTTYYDDYSYNYFNPIITVPGPVSGIATHTIEYWSVDRAGNVETPHTIKSFVINAQQAPMTWSNITPPELSTVTVRNPTVSITGQAQANITGVTAVLDGVTKIPTVTYSTTTTSAQVWVSSGYYQGTGNWYWDYSGCSAQYVEEYIWIDTSHYETQTTTVTDYTKATASFATSGLSDGVHTVTFTYTVTGGAQAIKTWTFTVLGPDNQAPLTTPIYSPSYVGTATVTLVATDNVTGNSSGVVATYYRIDNGAQTAGTPPTSTIYVAPPAYGAAVSHTIQFWSVDALGNTESLKSITFTVAPPADTLPPITTSNAVSNYIGTANISLTATDNPGGWGVATTYYKVDSGTTISGTSISVAAPTWGSAVHRIDFWSVDRAGNVETAKVATFTVNAIADTTAPSTSSNAQTVYSAPATITLTPYDAGWGVQATYWIVDNGAITTGTAVPTGGQGGHTLQFWSIDRAGNKETTKSVSYVVDMTAPQTTSNAVPSYAGTATVTLAATDNHVGSSGVRYTYYKLDGGVQTSGTVITVAGPKTGPGVSHTITYWSVDYAGNIETPAKTATFTVTPPADAIPPTTYATAAAFYAMPTTITLTATDNIGGWGVAHTYYIRDNGGQVEGTAAPTGGAGQHTLEFWSVDYATNIETPHKFITYTVDMTPPTTVSNAVASYTGTATITLTANDDAIGSGVKATYYKLDSGSSTTGTVITVPAPAFTSVDHTITFWSVDNMGNTEAQKTATFTVNALPDNAAPTSGSNAVATYARPTTITIAATENAGGWGVTAIYYKLDNGATVTGYTTTSGGVMSASCAVSPGGAGNHTLEFWAADKAGNVETPHKTVSYYITPDTTPPVTTSNAVGLYIGPATISLTATDNGGWGVDKTYYRVDGGAQTSGTVVSVTAPIAGSVLHSVTFWSTDLAGNVEAAKTATFTVSGIPANMTFSGITPADGSKVTTSWATISITAVADQNISGATMTLDGIAKTPNVSIVGMQGTATYNATGLVDGNHTVSVTWTNATGQQKTKTWSFTVEIQTDFTAPTTQSNAVLNYIGVANVTLIATDNPGGTGVKATYFKVDGGASQQGTLITINGPASGEPVQHTIQFWSVDYVNNVETTKTATFSIAPPDTQAPHSTSDARPFYPGPSTIQLSATDNTYGSGVAHIFYKLDGAAAVEGTLLGTGGVGTHVLEFWAVDSIGNVETPHNVVTYKVDATAPVTTSDAQLAYTGTAYINLTAADEVGGSGIKGTYYRIDDGWQTSGTTVTVPPPTSGSALHTVYFWSQDNAGNVETTKSATFTVAAPPDTTPPSTTSDARATYAVSGLIKLTATDNTGGWGVQKTYYKLDGGAQTEGTEIRTGGAGSHTLEFWSVDRAGNVENPHKTASYSVTANDTEAPVTSTDATSTYIGRATISLTATDNCGILPVTYIKLDSGVTTTGTTVVVAPPRSGSQPHTLYYRSVDLNGNSETTKSVSFTVYAQTANMTFSSISPTEGTTVAIRNPLIRVRATSGSLAIAEATLEIDGVSKTPTVLLNGPVADLTFAASGLTNGGHTVTATFVDMVGAVSTKSWTFTVAAPADVTAPSSACDAVAYYAGAATVRLTSADDAGGTGLSATYYRLDGGVQLSGTPPTTTISVTAAGQHTIEYWSVDLAGNAELPHKTATFIVDQQPPTTSSNAQDAYTGTANIALTAADNMGGSGVKATYFVLDSGMTQMGTSVIVAPPLMGNQWHTLYFWSVDNAGNVETTKSVTFNIWAPSDYTPPSTTSDVQPTYAVPGIIHLTATDTGGYGVAHTYYRLDGGTVVEGTFLGTGGAGVHTLEFWSEDAAGNIETPHKTVSYSVTASDTTAPSTSSDALASYNGPAVINLASTDGAGSGVAHTYYRIDGGAQTEGTMLGVTGDGPHTVEFWSVDWAGNIETPHKTVDFTIVMPDTTPPTTASNAVTSYVGTATVTLTATDNTGGTGVRTTYFRVDGGPVQQGTTIVVLAPLSGSVPHTIEYWSVDNAGNAEGSKSVTFNVSPIPDNVAPTTSANAVTGASFTGTATIQLTATDTGVAGVKATYWRLDGGAVQTGTTVTVAPPTSGSASHTLQYWSVDNQNNTETAKSINFTVTAGVVWTTATLQFKWDPDGYGTADLHVQNASGTIIATKHLSGYGGGDLYWDVTVPAGQNYYMVCDSYTDSYYGGGGGGYGMWTTTLTGHDPMQNNDVATWWY